MAIGQIDVDLGTQVNFLKEIGKHYEAKRFMNVSLTIWK